MIRSFDASRVPLAHTPLAHTPLDAEQNVSGDVTTAFSAEATWGDMEVGVWEHSVGTSTDVEIEEVFVVLEGEGTVTCDQGGQIDLAPGVVGLLPAGAHTTWTITKPVRKVWITLTKHPQ